MALPTRVYISSTNTPAISPPFHSGWDDTASAIRRACRRGRSNSTLTNFTVGETSAVEVDVLVIQGVSGPFGPHNYSGATGKGQVAVLESNAAADFRGQTLVRIADLSGNIIAEFVGFDTGALSSEFATTGAGVNRMFPRGGAVALDGLDNPNITVDHYVVVEWGYHSHNLSTTSRTATFRIGDQGSHTDLPEDETTGGNSQRPWFQISHELPIVTVDAYDQAVRDSGDVFFHYRNRSTSGIIPDENLVADLSPTGAPTYDLPGPRPGWKAISTDGVDDLFSSSNSAFAIYQGPGTVIGWVRTADPTQTHGETSIVWLAGGTFEGGGAFEIRNLVDVSRYDLHYLSSLLVASDTQGIPSETNVWRFFAVTAGTVGGYRFYMADNDVVTLQGIADITTDQITYEQTKYGSNQGGTVFGQWEVSAATGFKAEKTTAQLQAIYNASLVTPPRRAIIVSQATRRASDY